MRDFTKELETAVKVAQEAGQLVRDISEGDNNIKVEEKDVNDFVTNADKASEELIIKRLSDAFPEYDILAEESGLSETGDNHKWIIDPIDGTTNFTKGIPVYAVSIGLEVKGEIVAGAVYNIPMDEMFSAIIGEGSYLNGKKISVSETTNLDHLVIGTGFPFKRGSRFDDYMRLIEQIARKTSGIRRPGSAAIDLCWMACGRYDAFFEFGLHPWDIAAGSLIVKESGGFVKDTKGGDDFIYGRTILCANSDKVYEFMLENILKYYYGE
jgi:myo-inositol-1(or 4)-monophosphatase